MPSAPCLRCKRTLLVGLDEDSHARIGTVLRERQHVLDARPAVGGLDAAAGRDYGIAIVAVADRPDEGLGTIRTLTSAYPHLAVIALAMPASFEAALHAGADDVLEPDASSAVIDARIAVAERRIARDCVRDTTDDALAESHANLRALIENTEDFILFSDREGSPLVFNSAYARIMHQLLGIDMRPGLKPHELLPDAQARAVWDEHHQRVLSGERFTFDYEHSVDDQTTLYFEVSYNPVVKDGVIIGFSEFTRNVTAQRLAERALRDAHSDLERKVAERTADLQAANESLAREIEGRAAAEERLRRAEKLEALGHLAGGIAHDFNNQLVGVLAFADLIARSTEDENIRANAQAIMQAASRSASLIDSLLAFARKRKQESAPVDVHGLLEDVAAILELSIDRKIAIELALEAEAATVLGDPSLLHSALLNLGINARDAMPNGGTLRFVTDIVELDDLACRHYAEPLEPGRYLRAIVSDTGTGIAAAHLPRIFDPFFTTKEGGTGMGLAAVYGAAQSHRGAVSVTSRPNEGTRFELLLPLATAAPRTRRASEAGAAPSGAARVLVVDDEPMVREVLAAVLRGLGHEVDAFDDPEQALDWYRDHWSQLDLVIFDMIMPKLDGAQLFHEMRQINPNVRALLSSGYSTDDRAYDLLAASVSGVLPKPYGIDDVETAVNRALAQR